MTKAMNTKPPFIENIPVFIFLFVIVSCAAYGQIHPHFGVEVGVPLTDTLSSSFGSSTSFSTTVDSYHSRTRRFIGGPAFRMELASGLGFEFDALYQHVSYDHFTSSSSSSIFSQSFEQTTGERWQFPLLVQYGFAAAKVKPFVEGGLNISHIASVSGQVSAKSIIFASPSSSSSSSNSTGGTAATMAGFTTGGGVDVPMGHVHLRPEFRYTRWFSPTSSATGLVGFIVPAPLQATANFRTTQNEANFLLGISF